MQAFASKLLAHVRAIPVSPIIGLLGMALLSLGVAYVYLPAGLITGGVLLILAAVDMRL